MTLYDALTCPVCAGSCALLDVVDFNRSCEEERGKVLPLAGVPVYYALCGTCGFCYAPEIAAWPLKEFEDRIYNADYAAVDPDYREVRPRTNAAMLRATFGEPGRAIRHLDYGGGSGLLAATLRESGWQSASYDPFVDRDTRIDTLGRFDLITAFEVFEHVPDVSRLMETLQALLAPGGMVIFSTLLSDGHLYPKQRITWSYVAPRNGHISLYSRTSLAVLGRRYGWNFASFSELLHVFFTTPPPWASQMLRTPPQA
jgi:SAM-dependent methyltransferase